MNLIAFKVLEQHEFTCTRVALNGELLQAREVRRTMNVAS